MSTLLRVDTVLEQTRTQVGPRILTPRLGGEKHDSRYVIPTD